MDRKLLLKRKINSGIVWDCTFLLYKFAAYFNKLNVLNEELNYTLRNLFIIR